MKLLNLNAKNPYLINNLIKVSILKLVKFNGSSVHKLKDFFLVTNFIINNKFQQLLKGETLRY